MKPPRPGELDKLATIRLWQDLPDAGTGIDQTVDAGIPAWCRITPAGSALFYGDAQVTPGVTHYLATWRTEQLSADVIGGGHVVDYGDMRYRVQRVTDLQGGRAWVLMDLQQLGRISP